MLLTFLRMIGVQKANKAAKNQNVDVLSSLSSGPLHRSLLFADPVIVRREIPRTLQGCEPPDLV